MYVDLEYKFFSLPLWNTSFFLSLWNTTVYAYWSSVEQYDHNLE